MLAFGGQSTAGLVMQMATSRVSLFIISAQLGKASAGIYSVAIVMAETLWQAVAAVVQVNLPRASAAYARGETPTGTLLTSRLSVAVTLITALGLAAAAPLIVAAIFGPTFAQAVWPFRILLVGTGVYAACLIVGVDLLARGYAQFTAVASGITLGVSTLLYLVLVPRFGLVGAASAAAIGYLTSTLALVIVHRRRTQLPSGTLLVATPHDVATVWRTLWGAVTRRLG